MLFLLTSVVAATARFQTPNNGDTCGYTEFPEPFLGDCTETLNADAGGFAGNWVSTDAGGAFHYERIETCGDRLTAVTGITSGGSDYYVVHDWPEMDGSFANGASDLRVATLPSCDSSFAASGEYKEITFPTGESYPCFQFVSTSPQSVITKCLTDADELTWTIQIAGTSCRSVRKLRRTDLSYAEEQQANPTPTFSLSFARTFLQGRISFYTQIIAAPTTPIMTKMVANMKKAGLAMALNSNQPPAIMAAAAGEFQSQYIVCS